MNKNSIRIKDIAHKAQVSVGTVDRVLHNRGKVSEDVRIKVLQIIEELNYQPNIIARTLGSNKSYHVVAFTPDSSQDEYWQGPLQGIEKANRELKQYGLYVSHVVFNQQDVRSFTQKANEVTSLQPDGILLAPVFYRESLPVFRQWQTLQIPFIIFNTQIQEISPLSYVGQDSYQSGLLAAKLLLYGQKESATFLIAHIAEDIANSAHLIKKEQGFRDFFVHNPDLKGKYKIISADLRNPSDISFFNQMDRLMHQYPDLCGIFVTTSKAYEIATYLQHLPERNIHLIGYDLVEKNVHFLQEGVIDFVINQHPQGQGYWGIHHLADHLIFKKNVQPLRYLPLDIITKENLVYYSEIGNGLML